MKQKPSSDVLCLDEHTQPFFAPKWHVGKIEAIFPIYAPGLEGAYFDARLAQLLTGDWGAILQEQCLSVEGEITGRRFFFRISDAENPPVKNPNSKQQVKQFWGHLLAPRGPNCPEDKYRVLSGYICDFLARPHFDHSCEAGCLVKVENGYSLFDARKVNSTGQADFFAIAPTPESLFDSQELLELEEATFHEQMREHFRAAQGVLPESVRFSRMNDDEICEEILGHSFDICREVERTLSFLLGLYMKVGSQLEGWKEVSWKMLTDEPLQGVDGDGQYLKTEVWPDLEALRNRVLTAFGCHLPPYYSLTIPDNMSVRDMQARELATKFECHCDSPISHHEYLDVILSLQSRACQFVSAPAQDVLKVRDTLQ